MIRLPVVPPQWSPEWQAQMLLALEQRLANFREKGDIELQRETRGGVTRNDRIFIRSPNGTRYALIVTDDGDVRVAVADTGVQVVVRRWDDLRFPATGINPAGSIEPPTVDTDDGTLIFANNKDCIIAGQAQMPHEWEDERPIRPHIHLQFKTSQNANTRWKLEHKIAKVNGNFPAGWSSETITCANPQNVLKHCIFGFSEISMTGMTDSTMIKWRLLRLGASDTVLDTDTSDTNLLEFDIHYESDNPGGSIAEYPS